MLVVDLYALKPVYLLDLIEQILLNCPGAHYGQNVMRIHRALRDPITSTYYIASVHTHVLTNRHVIRSLLSLIQGNIDLALTTLDITE